MNPQHPSACFNLCLLLYRQGNLNQSARFWLQFRLGKANADWLDLKNTFIWRNVASEMVQRKKSLDDAFHTVIRCKIPVGFISSSTLEDYLPSNYISWMDSTAVKTFNAMLS